MLYRIWALLLALLLLPSITFADPPSERIFARVVTRSESPETINGRIVDFTDNSVTLHTDAGERVFQWTDLTGESAYAVRVKLIHRTDPQAWLKLGAFAWGMNATKEAHNAFDMVTTIDTHLKKDVDAALAVPPGSLLSTPPAAHEMLHDAEPGRTNLQEFDPALKYQKVTAAESAEAIDAARTESKRIATEMKRTFKEIETPHFLISTDWDPREYDFLRENLEAAYGAVSSQFDIPVKENVFVGKLQVLMFSKHEDFIDYARTYDGFKNVTDDVAGYYALHRGGIPHMAMSKPPAAYGTGKSAERKWAYVLTHEFTHAFVARYRCNRRIPSWLNEGIAEVIASSQFPRDVKEQAAEMARNHVPLAPLFADNAGPQSAEMYPVMRTLTETLIRADRQRFLKMFDLIKSGKSAGDSLKDAYNWSFDDLEKNWRKYLGV